MDEETTDIAFLPGGSTGGFSVDLAAERLDCENIEDMTMRFVDEHRPSFVTILIRFFGNIFVDCFRTIFE